MKTKLPLLLVTSLLSLVAIAGCKGKGGDGITVAIVGDNAEYQTMMTFVKSYNAIKGNENKKIKVVRMSQYHDYIFNSFLYDDLADIVQVFDISCEYYSNADLDGAGNSLLLPISSYMQRDGIQESDFFESIIDMTKCKTGSDEMYWIPRDYNKVVCAYNKTIFDLAGVDYPTDSWTWTQFVDICQTLNLPENREKYRKEYSGSTTFYPVDMNLNFEAVYYPILRSYGVELIDQATKTCFGNTEEAMNTAKMAWGKLLDMADSKLSLPPSGEQIPFTGKQAAMMFMVRPNLPTYVKGLGEDTIDFVSLPLYDDLAEGQKSYIGMGCTGYGMTTACPKNKRDAAWDFLKFIISEDGQNAFSAAGSGIPCLKKLADDPNAVFKQYLVTDTYKPNHNAFINYPERDVSANFMKGFETLKQLEIEKYIKDRTLNGFYKASDRDKYFADFKTNLEKIWNK